MIESEVREVKRVGVEVGEANEGEMVKGVV